MTLSISRINLHAPYAVEVEGDTSVRFITDYGIVMIETYKDDIIKVWSEHH